MTDSRFEIGGAESEAFIVGLQDVVLVTGASGFIGSAVVDRLLSYGFSRLRAFVRPTSNLTRLNDVVRRHDGDAKVEIVVGNLMARDDCARAATGAAIIFHLAAGTGDKSFPGAFMGSVVTTRNLLDAAVSNADLRRFVNISSFAVYTNTGNHRWRTLDERCPVATHPMRDAYSFAKIKQDQIVAEYCEKHALPYVIVRPGAVYGPGNAKITGRVGINTFGFFMHMGGLNRIPFIHVSNCADLIALAGLREGVDGEVFNAVDDDLPTSRAFLRSYKNNVRRFTSIYVPHWMSYILCRLWESYSEYSDGQLPLVFTVRRWHAEWKMTRYSNAKAKRLLHWAPTVSTTDGLMQYFESCREGETRG